MSRVRGVDATRTKVEQERARLSDWQARKADAEARLAGLRAASGETLLADPDSAEQIAQEMTRLIGFTTMADRAIVAAEASLHDSCVAAARVEADRWDAEAARRRAKLDKHEERTAELLAALADHEGAYISVADARRLREPNINYGPKVEAMLANGARKSTPLREAVEQAELAAKIIRHVIDGGDPRWVRSGEIRSSEGGAGRQLLVEELPDVVYGPDAILPAPRLLAEIEQTKAKLMALDTRAERLKSSIDAMEAEAQRRPPEIATSYRRQAGHKQEQLDSIPAERKSLRDRLRLVSGQD